MKSPADWSRGGVSQAERFVQVTELREMRGFEQVAAVCFRIRGGQLEFLLVQTRGGRWTFPKGGAEPGLTHAQAAALEAYEEAGVHGRMEEAAFTRYLHYKRGRTRGGSGVEMIVTAHLCEVLLLDRPQESHRHRTWFSAAAAKRRLQEGRNAAYGGEFARVVDRAVIRISQLRGRLSARPLDTTPVVNLSSGRYATQKFRVLQMPRRSTGSNPG